MVIFLVILSSLLILTALLSWKPKIRRKVIYNNVAENAWRPDPKSIKQTTSNLAQVDYYSPIVSVWVPLLVAVITGFLFALAMLIVIWIWLGWEWAIKISGSSFPIVTLLIWISRMVRHSEVTQRIEELIGIDLDGDHKIGRTNLPPKVIHIDHREPNFNTLHIQKRAHFLPGELETLAKEILVYKRPFTEEALCGEGKPFSQKRLTAIREILAEGGMIEKKGKGNNSGWRFTPDGIAALEENLSEDLTPLPHPGGKVSVLVPTSSTQAGKQA